MTEREPPTSAEIAVLRARHRPQKRGALADKCFGCGLTYPCDTADALDALDAARAALEALDAVLDFGTPVERDVRLGIPAILFDGAEDVNAAFQQAQEALTPGAAVAVENTEGGNV